MNKKWKFSGIFTSIRRGKLPSKRCEEIKQTQGPEEGQATSSTSLIQEIQVNSQRYPRNKGYDYENQLLLHACISLRRLQCQNFRVLPEDKDFPKFDDIVCKYEYGGKIYRIAIQSKTAGREKSLTEIVLRESTDYNLVQYIEAIADMQNTSSNCETFFILITPRKMSMNILPFLIDSSSAINAITDVFTDMFNNPNKTKAFQFKYAFLNQILPNFSEDLLNYALSKFIIITEAPDENDLEKINYKLLFGEHTDITVDPTKSIVELIENSKTNEEATITKEKFNILLSAIFEKDLTKISEDFLKNKYPLSVNFNENYLNQVNDKLKTCNFIISYENTELHALIVLQCVRKFDCNALLIPIMELEDFHLDLIERNIVIFIQGVENCKSLSKKPNIYYVGHIMMADDSCSKLPSFSYNSLSLDSKRNFESQYIDVQGYEVSLGKLKSLSNEYENIMTNIFIDLFDGRKLQFGSNLPKNTNIDTHVERHFSIGNQEKKNDKHKKPIVLEKDIFKMYNRCIITGDPGMGKSFTLMNMMTNFKNKYPEYLIKFFDLKLIHIFFKHFPRGKRAFDNSIKNIDNKHLLIKFLTFEENQNINDNELLNLDILEYYLSCQESYIILIFDGFDEIMPTYSDTFLSLVKKLIDFKIKIFISGESRSYEELEKLENFDKLIIKPYTEEKMKDFIHIYYKIKQKENKFLKEDHKHYLTTDISIFNNETKNSFIYTPLYLKMLIDVLIEEYRKKKKKNHIRKELNDINMLILYDKIFEISFNNYYEKEGIDPDQATARFQKSSKMHKVKMMYGKLAYNFDIDDDLKSRDLDKMEMLRRGFVKKSSSKKLYFIHGTFAEYFLASYLFNNFIENNTLEAVNEMMMYDDLMLFMFPMLIKRLNSINIVKREFSEEYFRYNDDIKNQMNIFYIQTQSEKEKVCELFEKLCKLHIKIGVRWRCY